MLRNPKVTAVVVTYNRKVLLRECMLAILSQTYPVWKFIIIDNCSTDGTEELLKTDVELQDERICYRKMESNLGGAGGFYEGIKYARQIETDWVWIMDDDTIPNNTALERLISAKQNITNETISFLASSVNGIDGEAMNVPVVDTRPTDNGYADWYFNLNNKMVEILTATFVSLLISKDAIDKVGLPCKDFFIWGDDTEYTTRLTQYAGKAYLVGDSLVCHKRIGAKSLSITSEEDKKRISNYFYYYRNNFIVAKYYVGNGAALTLTIKDIVFAFNQLKTKNGFKKFNTIIKAVCLGHKEYKKFKEYIDSQIRTS